MIRAVRPAIDTSASTADDQPGADGRAVDRRDDRLRAVDHVEHQVAGLAHPPAARRLVVDDRVDQLEAAAGGEALAGALDDRDAHVGVAVDRRPDVGELAVGVGRHRVEARRVERDPQDVLGGAVERQRREALAYSTLTVPPSSCDRGLGHVAERDLPVELRLPGQAEHALADDVALDLVRPAADRGEVGVEREEVGRRRRAGCPSPSSIASAPRISACTAASVVQDPRHRQLAERHDRRRGALRQLGLGARWFQRVDRAQACAPGRSPGGSSGSALRPPPGRARSRSTWPVVPLAVGVVAACRGPRAASPITERS